MGNIIQSKNPTIYHTQKKQQSKTREKKIKKEFGAGAKHYLYTAAAGYPLVVLAGGYEISRPPEYSNPNLS
jgi:hypothetical protein